MINLIISTVLIITKDIIGDIIIIIKGRLKVF